MAAEATAMASREGSAMMTAIAIATATVTMTTTTTTAMVTTATNNEDNKDKGGRYLVAGAQTTINMRCVEEESEHSRSKDVFLAGVVRFFLCGVLLTKEKVVCTTLCMTYVDRKHPQYHNFGGGYLHSYVQMYYFLLKSTTKVVFSD